MKKLTLLAMALVMALGALGVGYASWTDDITVAGTVTTGSVDFVLDINQYSGTDVWKDLDNHGFKVVQWVGDPETFQGAIPAALGDPKLIAYSFAEPGDEDDSVKIVFENIYPGIPFEANFAAHYIGSVPVRLVVTDLELVDSNSDFTTPDLDTVSLLNYVTFTYYRGVTDENGAIIWDTDPIGTLEGEQFEFCEWFKVVVKIELPQDNTLMKQYGVIDATIQAVQWDKYGVVEP